jgi:hypothetical protein
MADAVLQRASGLGAKHQADLEQRWIIVPEVPELPQAM